jgi:trimeric autotransporter adhesin
MTTGVLGWIASSGTGSAGVAGESTSPTGETTGVLGSVLSPDGYGVEGDSSATSGVSAGVAGFAASDQGRGVLGVAEAVAGANYGVRGIAFGDQGTGVSGEATDPTGNTVGLSAQVASANGTAALLTNTSGSGSLVIGRVTADGANVFRIDTTGKGYFNGGAVMGGADFAETFAVRKDSAHYEPGDVLAIDPEGTRRLILAQGQYSTTVAGVYSTKPGVLAAPQNVATSLPDGVPLAVVGVVPCKVTAQNGPIHAGDLLVVSSVPGRAMKATDATRMAGAIVGKALQTWTTGEGTIEILVTLQ